MPKRVLVIDWQSIAGAAVKKRKLHLQKDCEGIYQCTVESCLHSGFKSERGLRKHINIRHPWYLWFDSKPHINRSEASLPVDAKAKNTTHKMPAFSLNKGLGLEFLKWLQTTCGGDKEKKEAIQIGRRAMKFLMWAMGNTTEEEDAKQDYIDVCVGSPAIFNGFVRVVTEDWKLGASGALSYVKAISDLMDFRKSSGVSDDVLRTFVVTEVYLRRGKSNLQKRKAMEYSRNLDLESLIAKASWATLEELEKVIPFHSPKYQELLTKLTTYPESVSVADLTFCTRFIATFLFLRVKFSRPMSFRFITLDMIKNARENGGYIDATKFKTSVQYMFDTLVFTNDTLDILQSYIDTVRPLTKPKCDYLLVSTAGTQYIALGSAMSLLVYQVIGKSINPTRYRQIVETESSQRLNESQRKSLSDDMKHSSYVTKRSYIKRASRETAKDGAACMAELVGDSRNKHTSALADAIRNGISSEVVTTTEEVQSKDSESDEQPNDSLEKVIEPVHDIETPANPPVINTSADAAESHSPPKKDGPENAIVICDELLPCADQTEEKDKDVYVIQDDEEIISGSNCAKLPNLSGLNLDEQKCDKENGILNTDSADKENTNDPAELEIKKENAEAEVRKKVAFSGEEDDYLRKGVKKHGHGNWSEILKDKEYVFNQSRSRDALRMRAGKLKLKPPPSNNTGNDNGEHSAIADRLKSKKKLAKNNR